MLGKSIPTDQILGGLPWFYQIPINTFAVLQCIVKVVGEMKRLHVCVCVCRERNPYVRGRFKPYGEQAAEPGFRSRYAIRNALRKDEKVSIVHRVEQRRTLYTLKHTLRHINFI